MKLWSATQKEHSENKKELFKNLNDSKKYKMKKNKLKNIA